MWTCRGKGQRGLKHSWVKFRNRSLTPFPGTVLRVSYDIARISLGIETVVQAHMPLAERAVTLRWLMDVGGFP